MKKVFVIAVAAILGISSPVGANYCSMDVVPASTLLFPFVMYDYDADGNGQTTLISITNVSSRSQIVRLTLWTDFSVAVLTFNIVLTGYDLQTIDIRDILLHGVVPSDDSGANIWWDGTGTSNAGGTPFDDGPYSTYNALWGGTLDTHFATSGLPDPESTNPLDCDPEIWASSPNNYTYPIPQNVLDIVEAYLRAGEMATTGYRGCDWTDEVDFPDGTWFTNRESRPTLMYVTADVVGSCNSDFPDSDWLGYFGSPAGIQVANVLMGDVVYLDHGTGFSEAENAVHLEDLPDASASTTFYARYHGGSGSESREPLPTAWAFRYIQSNNGQADTWIRAWKGSSLSGQVIDLDDTDTGPGGTIGSANPSSLFANSCIPYTYYAWDDDENVNSVNPGGGSRWSDGDLTDPIPVPNLFPLETQEVPIDEFFVVGDAFGNAFGWMMVIWPLSNWNGMNPDLSDYDLYQTWMSVKHMAFGRFTTAMQGMVLANFNCDSSQTLPQLAIDLPR
jgi:hypothetical protein